LAKECVVKAEVVYPIVEDYVKLVAKAKNRSLSFVVRKRAKAKALAVFSIMTAKAQNEALRKAGAVVGEFE
jgi:hypothetical protein